MVNISGPYQDLEEFEEVDDDIAVEYPCPFCASDYDLVELCHHIDEEHQLDANNGVIATRIHLPNQLLFFKLYI